MKKLLIVSMFVLLGLAVSLPAQAGSATPPASGSVQYSTGITATGNWANTNTSLGWVVTDLGGGMWEYEYTWNALKPAGATGGEGLSHIIIEVTNQATSIFQNFTSNVTPLGPQLWTAQQGNPGMLFDTWGIKLTPVTPTGGSSPTNITFSFESNHAPVWGDFYAKDGNMAGRDGIDIIAYNVGFSALSAGAGVGDTWDDGGHIAVPDGVGVQVPEPGTLLLLGFGLIGLVGVARRRMK